MIYKIGIKEKKIEYTIIYDSPPFPKEYIERYESDQIDRVVKKNKYARMRCFGDSEGLDRRQK